MKERVFLLLGALHIGNAASVPIDCSRAKFSAEKIICTYEQLASTDHQISADFSLRLSQCPPQKRPLLRQTQRFWLRDRDACTSLRDKGAPSVERCVAERMSERLTQFERIGASCHLDAVAGQYRHVDPDYLQRFASRYLGRKVSVAGYMVLSSCVPRSSDTTGQLRVRPGTTPLAVRFKAMPPAQREFLCTQRPSSSWHGTVKRDSAGTYLYLTDVLGSPL